MKSLLRELLVEGRLEEIAGLARQKRRVLASLVSLTYDADPLVGWRAVEAMGRAAAAIAPADPQCVRNHLRRLYWLLSEESGGLCWRAPEAMAEIVCRAGPAAAEYGPIILSLPVSMAAEDLEHFRSGILWAIGRLGPAAAPQLDICLPAVAAALDHADSQVRGMAVWCLGQVGRKDLLAARRDLPGDEGVVDFYEDGCLGRTSVGGLLERALGGP
jgi:hypothetical protein